MKSAALVMLVLSACAVDAVDTGTATDPLADPIQACPIPDVHAIAGHEGLFYECAEQTAQCGPSGYLLGYGDKYAHRFYQQARPHMTARGQQWIDTVLVCLQRDLRDSIDANTTCDDIRATAFDSHPACYLDAGFCTLSPWDIAQVVWTIDLRDWASRDAARQVVTTAIGCGGQYAQTIRALFWYLI